MANLSVWHQKIVTDDANADDLLPLLIETPDDRPAILLVCYTNYVSFWPLSPSP